MKINPKIIPAKFRSGISMKPQYVTIHETANTSKGANAKAHANLQYNGNNRNASWHYTVDDKEVWQSIPEKEVAWHAGDGRGAGNMSSIAIEICVNRDGNFTQAKKLAAQLAAELLNKYNLPISRLVQHNKWSGKNCPANLRKSGWSAFKKDVETFMKGKKPVPKPPTWTKEQQEQIERLNPASKPAGTKFTRTLKYVAGNQMTGDDVLAVQYFLGVKPWKDKNGKVVGTFGIITRDKLKEWQKKNGIKQTGEVGIVNWRKMFGEKKPDPKPEPKPEQDIHRVKVDGKQVGAYRETQNIVDAVKQGMKKKPNRIDIEKVK